METSMDETLGGRCTVARRGFGAVSAASCADAPAAAASTARAARVVRTRELLIAFSDLGGGETGPRRRWRGAASVAQTPCGGADGSCETTNFCVRVDATRALVLRRG